ncbi:MAG: hypothetical protein AB1648_05015 [Pseudomonadota bacterium]
MTAVPHVRCVELPKGKLAIYEEFPDTVAETVKSFLRGGGLRLESAEKP